MNANFPECSVIIPVFNKWELTSACLISLHEHSTEHDLEVIVVDNGSTDETTTELAPLGKSLFGARFTSLVFPENRNFAPACNAGAGIAISPILFFLNNDTLATPGWAPPLLAALKNDENLGGVGPLLLYKDDTVQHMGVAMDILGFLHLYQGHPKAHRVVGVKRRNLQFITGAAFMMHAKLFHECGGFFEEYQNGYEDLDLCIRIRQLGKNLCCETSSVIYHLESQTPGRFLGESHNTLLFTNRCYNNCYIDAHHHALRDGFSILIDDFFSIRAQLKEKDEEALRKQTKNINSIEFIQLVIGNPLWVYGREYMADSLEKAKEFSQALPFRLSLLDIQPLLSRYSDVLRLLPLCKEGKQWLPKIERHIHEIRAIRSDKKYALFQLKKIHTHSKGGKDAFLEKLFMDKLHQLFP